MGDECESTSSVPETTTGVTGELQDAMLKKPPVPETIGTLVGKILKELTERAGVKIKREGDGAVVYRQVRSCHDSMYLQENSAWARRRSALVRQAAGAGRILY